MIVYHLSILVHGWFPFLISKVDVIGSRELGADEMETTFSFLGRILILSTKFSHVLHHPTPKSIALVLIHQLCQAMHLLHSNNIENEMYLDEVELDYAN